MERERVTATVVRVRRGDAMELHSRIVGQTNEASRLEKVCQPVKVRDLSFESRNLSGLGISPEIPIVSEFTFNVSLKSGLKCL